MLSELGSLAGGALGQIGEALSMPRKLAWRGAQGLYNALTGSDMEAPESGTELLARAGMDAESPITKALGFGAEVLLDPLTVAGGLVGRLGSKAISAATAAPGLQNARRGMAVFKGLAPTAEALDSAKAVGTLGSYSEAANAFSHMAPEFAQGALGAYSPAAKAAFISQGAGRETLRHELAHGMVDAARSGAPGLPLPFRAVASMRNAESPIVRGLGFLGDEALAHGVGESTSALGQLGGAAKFLTRGDPFYAQQVADRYSPLLAALYRRTPDAIKAGGALGAAGGGYLAGRQLFQE
jgi:hypothetical protein